MFITQWQHEASYLLYNRLKQNDIFQPSEEEVSRFISWKPTSIRKGPKTIDIIDFTITGAEDEQMQQEVIDFRRNEFQRFINAEDAIKDIIFTYKRSIKNESY